MFKKIELTKEGEHGMYYNYLLFVPSLVGEKSSEIHYTVDVDGISGETYPKYTGLQTNEGVTKFLIDYLQNSGETLNKIIMLCTNAVKEQPVPKIQNYKTLDYYKEHIIEFLKERNIKIENESDLFEDIDYIPQNNENENQIITKLEEIIKPEEDFKYKKRVFVDFTGGNRSSALTLVFACRILDLSNIEIAKIFYSNLKKENDVSVGIIEECTSTYKIFSALEEELKIKNDNIESKSDDGKSTVEIQLHKLRKEALKAIKMNQYKSAKEYISEIRTLLDSIDYNRMSRTKMRALKAIEERCEEMLEEMQDPLLAIRKNMDKGNYDKAISLFREKIIDTLYKLRIIKVKDQYLEKGAVKKDVVTNEISSVYGYYVNDKDSNTFLKTVKEYIESLNKHPNKSPDEVREEFFGDAYYSLDSYLNRIPKIGYKHNGYTKSKCDKHVIPYMEKYMNEGYGIVECMKRYSELDFLYMGYGYPFACTFGNQYYYDGYDRLYKKNFQNGVRRLQNLYEGRWDRTIERIRKKLDKDVLTYEMLIQILANSEHEDIMRELFPLQFLLYNIQSDVLEPERWSAFMFEFTRAFSVIRKVRNKIAHPKDLEREDVKKAIDLLHMIVEEIENLKKEIEGISVRKGENKR